MGTTARGGITERRVHDQSSPLGLWWAGGSPTSLSDQAERGVSGSCRLVEFDWKHAGVPAYRTGTPGLPPAYCQRLLSWFSHSRLVINWNIPRHQRGR